MMKKIFLILLISFFILGCSDKKQNVADEDKNQEQPVNKGIPLNVTVPDAREGDHVQGKEDAPVTIIIYSDFQNPFAARLSGAGGSLAKAKTEFGDKLKIIFRHYPQSFNQLAEAAAEFAECANEQGKFWQMHDKLFENNINNKFSLAQFKKNVEELGLDTAKFDECLNTDKYREKIKIAAVEAEKIGIRGTPTLFINGRHILGALSYEDYDTEFGKEPGLKSIIEDALKK